MATYSIGKNNVVTIDFGGTGLEQATWPDGTKWASKAEAEAWAKQYLAALEDPTAPRPGNSPEAPTLKVEELELTPEALEAAAAEMEALMSSNLGDVQIDEMGGVEFDAQVAAQAEDDSDIIEGELISDSELDA